MNRAQRLTPAERNRAIERLRVFTAGITFASISATLGFGYVAAFSNAGTQAVATTSGTTQSQSSSTSTDTSTTASSSPQASATVGSSSTSGSAHATSGGS